MSKNIWFRLYTIDQWDDSVSTSEVPKHNQLHAMSKRFLPHGIPIYNDLSKSKWIEINDWCEMNFYNRYCLWGDSISCRYKEDAMAFKLRWT